jgi:acylphosphatase
MSCVARTVRVSGLVQGVFFRAWTCEEARRLRLAGWVRNCADGKVEARIEGEADGVERMIALLNDGPPQAQVSHVEVSEAALEGLSGFEVRH